MAEYYRSEIRSARTVEGRRHSLSGRGVDLLMSILTLMDAVVMILTLLAPAIRPEFWLFPLLGLAAPATFVLTLCLALYWIIRWRWFWASVPLLLLLVSLFQLSLFLKLPLQRINPDRPRVRGSVKLMTYNVRQFYGPEGASTRDSLIGWVGRQMPDIICLQEFTPNTGGGSRALVDSLLGASSGRRYYATTGDTVTSQIIYSRYRILRSGRTRKDMTQLRSIWADLLVGEDTLRVFNNHLHSTAITAEDQEFLTTDNFLQDTAREQKVRSIVRRFCDNSITRAAQADSIAREVLASPYRTLVCGDFNDTPLSYVYRTMRGELQDAFRERGYGYGYTFCGFRNLLRIDYVLLDPSLEVLYYDAFEPDYSDHRPLLVTFKRD